MPRRLRSTKFPILTRIGFILCRPTEGKDSATRIAELLRHPLTVLLCGFVATGLVGSYITFSHDDRKSKMKLPSKALTLSVLQSTKVKPHSSNTLYELIALFLSWKARSTPKKSPKQRPSTIPHLSSGDRRT